MHNAARPILAILTGCLLLMFFSACQRQEPTPNHQSVTPSATARPLAAPSPSSTAPIPKVLIVSSQDITSEPYAAICSEIGTLSKAEGWFIEWQRDLDPSSLPAGAQLVVFLTPGESIAELEGNHPEIPIITIGLSEIQPRPNISILGPDGYRLDQQAFAAGYLSAVITKEWRIGALIQAESELYDQLVPAFANGVVYYCGLCRSVYPPFYQYPIAVQVSPQASEADWINAAQTLLSYQVGTVFIYAREIDQAAIEQFNAEDVKLVGTHYRSAGGEEQWAATVRIAPEIVLRENWNELIYGGSGVSLPLPIILDNVNPAFVSQGREAWVERILDDLIAGFIDTGVLISHQSPP